MTEQQNMITQDQTFDPGISSNNASSSSHINNIENNNNNFTNPTPLAPSNFNSNNVDDLVNQQFSVLGSTFSIATNNVCGLSSLTKQQQITTLMATNKYDIFGVSETRLTPQAIKLIYKDDPDYTSWWNCLASNPTSAGVGLIMHHSTTSQRLQRTCHFCESLLKRQR